MIVHRQSELETPSGELPEGVRHRPLAVNADHRGSFTEVFRNEWDSGMVPIQWNIAQSVANVLRGVHVHIHHDDYLVLVGGRVSIGLQDMRVDAATFGLACTVELCADRLSALTIPRGVAHAFLFHEPSTHVYAVSRYWNPDDELACHYQDPKLKIPWKVSEPLLSERDERAGTFLEMLERLTAERTAQRIR